MKNYNRLRELRLSKGWLQQQVADRIGVSQVMVSKYESGYAPIPGHLIEAFARMFSVPPRQLFIAPEEEAVIAERSRSLVAV